MGSASTAACLAHPAITQRAGSTADRERAPSHARDTTAASAQGDTGHPVERRIRPRRRACLVPSITGIRLSPRGGEASLVNISTTGALVRCNTRLLPGEIVMVVFDGQCSPSSVKSRVARCLVADIDSASTVWYEVGIAFSEPLVLKDVSAPTSAPPEPARPPRALAMGAVSANRW